MINREEIIEFIKANKKHLKNHFHLTKIGVFGSFARNEQSSASDIDIIIELRIILKTFMT